MHYYHSLLYMFVNQYQAVVDYYSIHMYNKEYVKRAISEFKKMKFPESIARDINIDISTNKIIVLAGIRRSGKTYEVFNIIKNLLNNEIPEENIFYVNFEDERFMGFKATDFDFLMDTFHSLTAVNENYQTYLFFDEIQNIENWERPIRRLYDTNKYKIFLTGSSSKLLKLNWDVTNIRCSGYMVQ